MESAVLDRKHAVLEEWEGLYYLHVGGDDGVHHIQPPKSIDQFIPLFEQHKVEYIWVMPGCRFSERITWDYIGRYDHALYNVFPDKPLEGAKSKKPTFMRIRRERQPGDRFHPEYFLAFPQWEDWKDSGKTWDCPTSQTLLRTVSYVEVVRGTPPAWSPQNMGRSELRTILDRRGWKIEPTILNDHLGNIINRAMQRPTWVLDVSQVGSLRGKKWAIGADKNGQYVGGTRNLTLGNGQYTRVVGPDRFDVKVPGIWCAQVTSVRGSLFDGYRLFCPWTAQKGWFSTDLLAAASAVGIKFELIEGVIWEQSNKFMDLWGKNIWEYREQYFDTSRFPDEVARMNAAGTAKQIGNSLIGLIAKTQATQGRGMVYRPDWNVLIIHKAIANLMYSLRARHEKHGILPALLARGDTQWIIADEPVVPGLFDYPTEQRGWKPIGKPIPVDDEIIEMFAKPEKGGVKANEQKAGEIAAYLEQRARSL
jgi:hypothetical protein